ncbi:MAG: hypothetical protein IIV44_04365 [Rikenellaceae bacterium]|nr:hypothetical protein [Rikenellaceae bacterium]
MKRTILLFVMGILLPISLFSQNPKLNPLNYSGKMYVSSVALISTPRYVSYGDHALLSTDFSLPSVDAMPIEFDFKNNVITLPPTKGQEQGEKLQIKNVVAKTYKEGYSETIVISMQEVNDPTKLELVWSETTNPYLLVIMQEEDNVSIMKYTLSQKHSAPSTEQVLMQLLGGGF